MSITGHVPGTSWLHRAGPGATWLLTLAPSVAVLAMRQWWAALALVMVSLALLVSTRVPLRLSLRLGWSFVVVIMVLGAIQLLTADWRAATVVVATITGCLLMSRVLTLTTPANALVDGLVRLLRPLQRFGVPSDRAALAVALMLRTVDWLTTSVITVRDAARARGLERHVIAQVSPVVVAAVAHAQHTGEALAARGLGDDPD